MDATKSGAAVEKAKAERLAKEWPKRCGCGRTFCPSRSLREPLWFGWEGLDLRGIRTDDFATFELRNCFCGSTLMAAVEIHDLAAE